MFTSSTFALSPFTPRVTWVEYISEWQAPVVYIAPGSTSLVQCPLLYPFDPRNQSLSDETYF